MSARDRRLAETKYKDRKSASQTAREAGKGSRLTAEELRLTPRSQESRDRAARHKRSLPPLG